MLIRSSDVLRLTGLTSDQLREWTVRRGLIVPDVPSAKRGNEAKFSWQTVLLLRLAVVLRKRFQVELQAHREVLLCARELLQRVPFPALWGKTLAIYNLQSCELLSERDAAPVDQDAVLLRLDEHLHALSSGLGISEPVTQLPLFAAVSIESGDPARQNPRPAKGTHS